MNIIIEGLGGGGGGADVSFRPIQSRRLSALSPDSTSGPMYVNIYYKVGGGAPFSPEGGGGGGGGGGGHGLPCPPPPPPPPPLLGDAHALIS